MAHEDTKPLNISDVVESLSKHFDDMKNSDGKVRQNLEKMTDRFRQREEIQDHQVVEGIVDRDQVGFFKYGVHTGPQGKSFYAQSIKLNDDAFPDQVSKDAMHTQLSRGEIDPYELDMRYFEKNDLLKFEFGDDISDSKWTIAEDPSITVRTNFSFMPDDEFLSLIFEEFERRHNPQQAPEAQQDMAPGE